MTMSLDATTSCTICRPNQLGAAMIAELARLHIECLPSSLFSRLGFRSTHCLYRFVAGSNAESLAVAFDQQGLPVGASVTSFEPATLLRRALLASPLSFFLLFNLNKLPWRSIGDSIDHGLQPLPELMFLFVSPALRSGGIGRELVLLAQNVVLASGGQELSVLTEELQGNRAVDFYQQLGYGVRARARKFGKPFLVFTRRLP